MTFLDKINDELKAALKTKDESRLKTLRMLKSDLSYKGIELGRELTEEDILSVLSTAAKKRTEAMNEYRRGGREDLYNEEKSEYDIIHEFLPEQLSSKQLEKIIDEAIEESGASSVSDLGNVMKILMPKIKGRADGKAVNIAVREKLMAK